MKKLHILAAVLCCALLAGCGGKDGIDEGQGGLSGASEGSVLTASGDGAGSGALQGSETAGASGDASAPGGTAASGAVTAPAGSGAEKMDILSDAQQVFSMEFDDLPSRDHSPDINVDNYGDILNMQFYQGEPVLLWMKEWERYVEDGTEGSMQPQPISDGGLYLSKTDGSRELLIPCGMLSDYFGYGKEGGPARNYGWYLDRDGGCYCRGKSENEDGRYFFLKLDTASGEVLYKSVLEQGFKAIDFCQAPDGRMYLVLETADLADPNKVTKLVEFDPDTGAVSNKDAFTMNTEKVNCTFGEGEDGIYMEIPSGYYRVNLEDGTKSEYMIFQGTTYSSAAWRKGEIGWGDDDFHVLYDGSVEILYMKKDYESFESGGYNIVTKANVKAVVEKLWLSGIEREPVVVRGRAVSNWLKGQAASFNRSNETYQVVLEEFSGSGSVDLEEYARMTSVEIAAGKGPDILYGDFMEDYICGMLDKGALLDLTPYMEASGIREEEYLPLTFGSLRDGGGIYGVNAGASPVGYKIKKEVLEGRGGIDIGTLVDALNGWGEKAVYYSFYDSGMLLEMFLEGSENLWGMVDWEQGTCDFSGELFAGILEAAKNYGYDGRNAYPNLVQSVQFSSLYRYDSAAELEKEGMVMCGVLFGDGCHGAVDSGRIMAVNAGSARKDGAWEFISFLLGEEAQAAQDASFPVSRTALGTWMEKELALVADGRETGVGTTYIDGGEMIKVYKEYTAADITEGRVEEYLKALEEVRPLPIRTAPILEIVYEEAADYFGGGKGVQEVGAVIENRVQLYLDENR